MLSNVLVLVVEDEPFIALDVALAIEDAHGEVAGPAASVAEALDLLTRRPVAAAILDVNLPDGDISPVVEVLLGAGVPMILQSGVGAPPELTARFPNLVVHIKPFVAARLVALLAALVASDRAARAGKNGR